ncbi:hypothetical protein [Novosphingobium sp. AP12]|uniref:DUF6894 family protein n=1 Tax=Novosphingobium sp. AP12 TaxID=1144305 RepID=UPI00027214A4|nr:hypothetical protein [Novosphingobium sp. AP12]EJL32313.1 hypothetical protein PMI02_01498 [Novosphingobium sp. AP12]
MRRNPADRRKMRLRGGEAHVEWPTYRAAREEAIRYAGEMMQSRPEVLNDGQDFRVTVTDDNNQPLFSVICIALETGRLH